MDGRHHDSKYLKVHCIGSVCPLLLIIKGCLSSEAEKHLGFG